jgi:hypothetical protein
MQELTVRNATKYEAEINKNKTLGITCNKGEENKKRR